MRHAMAYPLAVIMAAALLLTACGGPPPVTAPTPLQDIANPTVRPSVLWTSSGGGGSEGNLSGFQIAIEGSTYYVANTGGDVAAFDVASGRQIWRRNVEKRLISGPAVAGNVLLVGTRNGRLLALSASSGEQLWATRVGGEVIAPPAVANGIGIVHTLDGRLIAYQLDDGSRLWTVERNVPSLTMRGASVPVIRGNRVYAGLANGHVIALDLQTGKMLWDQTIALPTGRSELARMVDIDGTPKVDGNTLLAASIGGKVAALAVSSGRVRWKQDIASADSVAYNANFVFVTDLDGVIHAINRQTGTQVWAQPALKYRELTGPAVYNGYVVVGDYEGYLHWLDPQTGELVGRNHVLGTPIRQQPIVINGQLLLLGIGGGVAAVQAG